MFVGFNIHRHQLDKVREICHNCIKPKEATNSNIVLCAAHIKIYQNIPFNWLLDFILVGRFKKVKPKGLGKFSVSIIHTWKIPRRKGKAWI